jgi:hypothetical protein
MDPKFLKTFDTIMHNLEEKRTNEIIKVCVRPNTDISSKDINSYCLHRHLVLASDLQGAVFSYCQHCLQRSTDSTQ